MTEPELIKLYNKGVLIRDIAERADMARGSINNWLLQIVQRLVDERKIDPRINRFQ